MVVLSAAPVVLAACGGGTQSALNPHGPAASEIATLWWVLFAISMAVVVIVFGLLGVALFRRRDAPDTRHTESHGLVITLGVAAPAVILIGAFGFNLHTMLAIDHPASPATVHIQVIGHQWWWEVQYLQPQKFATANEIHVPVGEAVQVQLIAPDVIHSFWVPELQKKVDMIPGRTNTTWLQADQPGDYRGQCAEYCGTEHGQMAFHVVAQSPADFQVWLQAQAAPAQQPTGDQAQGVQVFAKEGCISCHAIQYGSNGPTGGTIGPDLTHLASRQTIAAGELANTPDNLTAWVRNAQAIKPGNFMPQIPMNSQDVQALVSYLDTLK
ncbi:MAG TPA: cytochrome c oxidase subunit II [Chloroflexota bacterium]|nr:cytochrome c oxidase subunit II [Chloroflexota bacterium]